MEQNCIRYQYQAEKLYSERVMFGSTDDDSTYTFMEVDSRVKTVLDKYNFEDPIRSTFDPKICPKALKQR